MRVVAFASGMIAATVAVAGCAAGPPRSAVDSVAVQFAAAVRAHHGDQACALMTPDAQDSTGAATNVPCAQAVLNIDETSVEVRSVQIWGDAAQVRLGGDVIFLRRLNDGWRVRAAGCQAQAEAGYKCDAEG